MILLRSLRRFTTTFCRKTWNLLIFSCPYRHIFPWTCFSCVFTHKAQLNLRELRWTCYRTRSWCYTWSCWLSCLLCSVCLFRSCLLHSSPFSSDSTSSFICRNRNQRLTYPSFSLILMPTFRPTFDFFLGLTCSERYAKCHLSVRIFFWTVWLRGCSLTFCTWSTSPWQNRVWICRSSWVRNMARNRAK